MKTAFDEAIRLTKKNDYKSALISLFTAYSLEPNATITFSIANCYRHLGQFELAIEYYRRYRIEGGTEPQVTISRIAERQIIANDLPAPSSEWINHWLAIKSLDSDLIKLLNKADAYRNIQDTQHSIPIYAKVLNELPPSHQLHKEVESRIEKLSSSSTGTDDRPLPNPTSDLSTQRAGVRPRWRVILGVSLVVAGTAVAIGGAIGASLPIPANKTGSHFAIVFGALVGSGGLPIAIIPDSGRAKY